MDGVSAEQLWQAVNLVKPGLIRVDADEATYNLHIMIRYEIEKQLIAGEIDVDDLPDAWDEMYMNTWELELQPYTGGASGYSLVNGCNRLLPYVYSRESVCCSTARVSQKGPPGT